MSMISSTALRYFAEVVRQASFSAAAEKLCIAPSAISRQIALLEEELAAPLFERRRGRRQQQLTAAGEYLMSYVYDLEGETRRIRSDIQSLKGMQKGQIRFGMTESFIHHIVPALLARFSQQYPAITFDVEVANTPRLIELVADGQLDVVLGFNPPEMVDVKHVLEVKLPRHVIVPLGHPLAQRAFVRLSDCAAYGMALPGGSLTAKAIDEQMFATAKIKPRAVLRTNSYELMQTPAMAGLAICLANGQLLPSPEGATPGHRFVPIRDARAKPTRVTVSVREHRSLPVAVLTFIEELKQEFGSLEKT